MRKVMYTVKKTDGTKIDTANYFEAKNGVIEKTYLVDVDTRTEKEIAATAKHAAKAQEFFKRKRG